MRFVGLEYLGKANITEITDMEILRQTLQPYFVRNEVGLLQSIKGRLKVIFQTAFDLKRFDSSA